MAAIQLLFACCVRGRTRRNHRRIEGLDEQVIPDEESRLIPPTLEPEPVVPDTVAQEIEERKARLGTIVRAKEGNMINTSAYAPFNVLNRPNRYSPQRYGLNRSGSSRRSPSRSVSREPSTTRRPSHSTHSVSRYGYLAQGYGYGAVGVSYNPSLVHTISIPAPLEPQSSVVQVQIESAAEGRASLERSPSKKRDSRKGTGENTDNAAAPAASGSGTESDSNNKPPPRPPPPHPRFRSSLVMSPSSTSLPKTTSHESFSDNNSVIINSSLGPNNSNSNSADGTVTKIRGLGVKLVQQPSLSAPGATSGGGNMGIGMSRRGRPKVKAGGAESSGSSGSLVRVWAGEDDNVTEGAVGAIANGSGQSSSEQTPRLLSSLPALSISPAAPFPVSLAPPPSPHSDRNSDSGQSVLQQDPSVLSSTPKPPLVFKIKDEGELTIGWDD
ncbi:hypothetical protein F5890DRAFT_1536810 [Lentinula detonsa]|uniref:Uncharacterized protein n=1 Tax=Lentinula detonsa TaxID=2804962 RepID=A0AA38PT53_9AGAR|nr:hypothetical protein F5890DRAFT_1536810 [Lentinula detonsa]